MVEIKDVRDKSYQSKRNDLKKDGVLAKRGGELYNDRSPKEKPVSAPFQPFN
jgi:hypothetical protein